MDIMNWTIIYRNIKIVTYFFGLWKAIGFANLAEKQNELEQDDEEDDDEKEELILPTNPKESLAVCVPVQLAKTTSGTIW